jgi:hypothetical protein
VNGPQEPVALRHGGRLCLADRLSDPAGPRGQRVTERFCVAPDDARPELLRLVGVALAAHMDGDGAGQASALGLSRELSVALRADELILSVASGEEGASDSHRA